MKIVAVGGVPGSGKTTLMKIVMEQIGKFSPTSEELCPLLPGHKSEDGKMVVLGRYDPDVGVFGGTDKTSMAVMPKAIEYLRTKPFDVVLFEGDRLFAGSFLEFCVDNFDTKIIFLNTDKTIRQERFVKRGSKQDPTWLAGRDSKVDNIATNFMLSDNIFHFPNNKKEDMIPIVNAIKEFIVG